MYTKFLAIDDDERVKEAYRGGKYERLARIKSKYDPTTSSTRTRTSALPMMADGRKPQRCRYPRRPRRRYLQFKFAK